MYIEKSSFAGMGDYAPYDEFKTDVTGGASTPTPNGTVLPPDIKYVFVTPDGKTTTAPAIPATIAGVPTKTLLIGAGILLALYLIMSLNKGK